MARSFNGTSDQITYSAATCSGVSNSISIWFYQTVAQAASSYFTIHDKHVTNHFLGIFGSGNIVGGTNLGYYSGGAGQIDPGTSSYNNNVWNHVAVVLSGSGTTMKAYLNGVADGTGSWTTGDASSASQLGYNSSNAHWGGYLADFAIWSGYALTTTDIANLFAGVRPASIGSGLQIYSPLDGFASPETDLSGNGNTGTLTGTSRVLGPPPLWRVFGS